LYADSADRADRFRDSRRRQDHSRQGSPGSKMKTIVNAPPRRIPGNAAHDEAAI
jgi:hypothetical protein